MSNSCFRPCGLGAVPRALLVLTALLALGRPDGAAACSVPVFRYALEHWETDPYVAIVFHRGPLTDEQRALTQQLDPRADAGYPLANIVVRTVDLDDAPSEAILDLWKQHATETLPLLSLQTPPKLGPPQTAWSGELSSENVSQLLESPIRDQLRQRLLGGESVVWVFLESGDQPADDAAFRLLEEELARLQGEIELPPIEEQDLAELSVDPAVLKLAFTAVRLSRDDPAEASFIQMLLHVEPDLRDEPYVSQAMAFPVFGRGRALYSLVGDGITAETIEDASRFLAGACQCTVKAQNPGVDLLLAVDWQQHVTPALPYDDSQPSLTGLASFAKSATETPESEGRPASTTESAEGAAAENITDANEGSAASDAQPTASAGDDTTGVALPSEPTEAASVESLTQNITVLLGLMVAGVVLVTLIVLARSR